MKATAVIKEEPKLDPRTRQKDLWASLTLLDESGKEYGPLLFPNFEAAGARLTGEAGVTYEELSDRYPRYKNGEEVRIRLNLETVAAIGRLGFNKEPSGGSPK